MQRGSKLHESTATLTGKMCKGLRIGFGLVVRCIGVTKRDTKKKNDRFSKPF